MPETFGSKSQQDVTNLAPKTTFVSNCISLFLSQNQLLEIAWHTPQPHSGAFQSQIECAHLIAWLPQNPSTLFLDLE